MTRLRCAIYTRKSTEDGLEQEFNSLDAQREACEAYVKSQAHEGWNCLGDRYDDGGFSGGSMNRPGLQTLLGDIDAGRVDVVVVYKVDRLTRSLLDFAHIVQRLEDKGVSFVSVTQSFNTTSSMGRLTLNVLLSFAQFEREVTGERIRDKIAASKKKGIWMGGPVPLGYDLRDRKLYINEGEARTVRWLFETYLDLGNVKHLTLTARDQGLRSKRYTQQSGKTVGGHYFSRGQLYYLLRNPLYAGKIRHKDKLYEGEHEAIIDHDIWEKVQALLDKNGPGKNKNRTLPSPSWVAGLLYDDSGERMVASHSQKGGRRYRYYISASLRDKKTDPNKGWRLPARQVEDIILTSILDLLRDPVQVLKLTGSDILTSTRLDKVTIACARFSKHIQTAKEKTDPDTFKHLLRPLIQRIDVSLYEIRITFDPLELRERLGAIGPISDSDETPDQQKNDPPRITVPVQLKRRGAEMRLVIPGQKSESKPTDETLVKLVARAHCWFEDLKTGKVEKVRDIAEREQVHPADVSRILPLAFLAPDIVTAILHGEQPVDLTPQKLKRLKDLPLDWQDQRRVLGFVWSGLP
ncbi:recombinase family protein [Kordiimonas lipolytica]|uniref:Recombinase family protein n=1 Tax=Kordiimonas lipolytica TaxID=1662421 RepID=A0ABV8UFF0_9PROT|nr:recombinase family protein [Kordiimonas lipolytica]